MSNALKIIKGMLKTASFISPKLGGKMAFSVFQKVRKKDVRNREKSFFASAFNFKVPYSNGTVDGYIAGPKTGKTVFMMHGWDSNAGSMQKIANELIEHGHQVIAINLPGHAFSKKSWSNIHDCKEALKATFAYINIDEYPIDIVTHSFGSAVVSYTLSELKTPVNNLIYITTPNAISDIFDEYQRMVDLNDKAYGHMVNRAEKLVGEPLIGFHVAKKLELANFQHLHLIHDPADKILPYSNSETIHSEIDKSSLIPMEKSGHYRILWKDEVVEKVRDIVVNNPSN